MKYKNISNILLVITGALVSGLSLASPNDYDGKWNGFINCTAYVGNPALGAFTRNNAYAIENGVISAKYTTAEGKNTLTTEGAINNKVAKLTINGVNAASNWTFNFTGNIPSVGKIMFTGDMVELGTKRRDCTMVFTVTDPAVKSLAYKEANPAPVAKAETAKSTPAITPTTNTAKVAETKTVVTPSVAVVAPTVVAKVPATQPAVQPAPATTQAQVISSEQALKVEETPPVASQEAQPQALQAPAPVIQTPPAKPFTLDDLINNTYVLIGVAIALLILAFFIIRAILRFLKRKAIEATNATKKKANEISEKINAEANAIKDSVTQNINDLKDKASELSDAAKERANELSSIAQGKATELTEIAKGQADKFSEDFRKEGGHKDKIKEVSAQGLSMAQGIAQDLRNEAQKINQARKDTLSINNGSLTKKEMVIYFWELLTKKQKWLIIGATLISILLLSKCMSPTKSSEQATGGTGNDSVAIWDKEVRNACKKYKTAVQECATAQDLNQCLEIKMGRSDAITVRTHGGCDVMPSQWK